MKKRNLFLCCSSFLFFFACMVLHFAVAADEGGEIPDVRLKKVFPHHRFHRPLYLTHAGDGTDRIFVVERGGKIFLLTEGADSQEHHLFLDLSEKVKASGEMGLLGLAFHPKFEENGFFYVYYSDAASAGMMTHETVLCRYSVRKEDLDKGDPDSELRLLSFKQPYRNHNGGGLEFGPDGYLYLGLGDGGAAGDPKGNGQDSHTLLGSIIRIDVDSTMEGKSYGIPKDNPFVDGKKGAPEIFAWGLRNPWRFSFDRKTGELWCADVGQNRIEEVDLVRNGKNYGWNVLEGTRPFKPDGNAKGPFEPPVSEYQQRVGGKSITGGYVYRGKKFPSLDGIYIYGDYVSGKLFAFRWNGEKVTAEKTLLDTGKPISSFGEDRDGEIYLVSFDGTIFRIEPAE